MKNKLRSCLVLAASILFLSSCASPSSSSIPSQEGVEPIVSSSSQDDQPTDESLASLESEDSSKEIVDSSIDLESEESSLSASGKEKIRVYATNDMHGQIYGTNPSSYSGRLGMGKTMTYLKQQKETEENVFILDQGDTWQGSIYSNFNYGALITDMMNYVHFDARTVGNHDFDWGLNPLIANGKRDYEGYSTPVLAANVYEFDFDAKKVGAKQMEEIGGTSVCYTLPSGLKVGIVGVIGENQITSITSLYVHDVAFKSHVEIAKNEAIKLKEEGCDITILSVHAGRDDLLGNGLSEYFDLVLCGHTHRNEVSYENGVAFAQFGCYTQGIGYIELEYDHDTGKTETVALETRYSRQIESSVSKVDPEIESIMEGYYEECEEAAKEVVAKDADGYFDRYDALPNLMCEAIYDTAIEQGFEIDLSYCNEARNYIGSSYSGPKDWTYADVYEAFPFENEIYILDITVDEMESEILQYNRICKDPHKAIKLESGKTYKIAAIDYLAFHTNARREYNYFPSVKNYQINEIEKLDGTYRGILCSWLKKNGYASGEKTLSSENFSSSLPKFSKDSITA